MATHNVLIRRRNTENNGYDNILPVTTAENVLVDDTHDVTAYFDKSSYIAFCTNANAASLDAAFGKGNEGAIVGLGDQIYMYDRYSGYLTDLDSIRGINTLAEIMANPTSVANLYKSPIISLIKESPFATSKLSVALNDTSILPKALCILSGLSEATYTTIASITASETAMNAIGESTQAIDMFTDSTLAMTSAYNNYSVTEPILAPKNPIPIVLEKTTETRVSSTQKTIYSGPALVVAGRATDATGVNTSTFLSPPTSRSYSNTSYDKQTHGFGFVSSLVADTDHSGRYGHLRWFPIQRL